MDLTARETGSGLSIIPPTKSPEAESETPPRIQPSKAISFSNGVLKRHAPPCVVYKECLKNHAANSGGHALDGCGEFMPVPNASSADPTSLKCAACGCHRNFHRREPEELMGNTGTGFTHMIEYHPHHRHHPLPPPGSNPMTGPAVGSRGGGRSPGSSSPPPISSTYYPGSAPHMLLALSGGGPENGPLNGPHQLMNSSSSHPASRKRFRTKFTQNQKDKMYEFAEKVGWKMQKTNEEMVNGFCNEIGVEKGVFKVWMHNNKNTFGKRSASAITTAGDVNGVTNYSNLNTNPINNNDLNDDNPIIDEDEIGNLNGNGNSNSSSINNHNSSNHHIHHHHHQQYNGKNTNGSSSSS
ncbi:unnamed protein product [Amaranthus hypochondriacus]